MKLESCTMKPGYADDAIECSQLDLDGLSSESGIDTGSDQTDGDSPLPDINARLSYSISYCKIDLLLLTSSSRPWKLQAIAESSHAIVSRRNYYQKMSKANDARSLSHLPSHHWKCSLSMNSRDTTNCWKNVDIKTLAQAWDKLCYLPELPSEIKYSQELCKYYRVS